ncbi:hypothetical protein V5O48_003024 [Marasmius crinis-equi]|uniref:Ubiquitin-like protease family profile domain-containing protein n=1 Tax=Marasmius crinis-equi TaxID=585013 RepID=A0ABR3FUI2_9AGAR
MEGYLLLDRVDAQSSANAAIESHPSSSILHARFFPWQTDFICGSGDDMKARFADHSLKVLTHNILSGLHNYLATHKSRDSDGTFDFMKALIDSHGRGRATIVGVAFTMLALDRLSLLLGRPGSCKPPPTMLRRTRIMGTKTQESAPLQGLADWPSHFPRLEAALEKYAVPKDLPCLVDSKEESASNTRFKMMSSCLQLVRNIDAGVARAGVETVTLNIELAALYYHWLSMVMSFVICSVVRADIRFVQGYADFPNNGVEFRECLRREMSYRGLPFALGDDVIDVRKLRTAFQASLALSPLVLLAPQSLFCVLPTINLLYAWLFLGNQQPDSLRRIDAILWREVLAVDGDRKTALQALIAIVGQVKPLLEGLDFDSRHWFDCTFGVADYPPHTPVKTLVESIPMNERLASLIPPEVESQNDVEDVVETCSFDGHATIVLSESCGVNVTDGFTSAFRNPVISTDGKDLGRFSFLSPFVVPSVSSPFFTDLGPRLSLPAIDNDVDMEPAATSIESRDEPCSTPVGGLADVFEFYLDAASASAWLTETILGVPESVLVKGHRIWARDLRRLQDGRWLNDAIINGYMSTFTFSRRCWVLDSVCWSLTAVKIRSRTAGEALSSTEVRRNGTVLESSDYVLIPVHSVAQKHWVAVAVDLGRHRITLYDSVGHCRDENYRHLQDVQAWLSETYDRCGMGVRDWCTATEGFGSQTNGFDCGVFTIVNLVLHGVTGGSHARLVSQSMIPSVRAAVLHKLLKADSLCSEFAPPSDAAHLLEPVQAALENADFDLVDLIDDLKSPVSVSASLLLDNPPASSVALSVDDLSSIGSAVSDTSSLNFVEPSLQGSVLPSSPTLLDVGFDFTGGLFGDASFVPSEGSRMADVRDGVGTRVVSTTVETIDPAALSGSSNEGREPNASPFMQSCQIPFTAIVRSSSSDLSNERSSSEDVVPDVLTAVSDAELQLLFDSVVLPQMSPDGRHVDSGVCSDNVLEHSFSPSSCVEHDSLALEPAHSGSGVNAFVNNNLSSDDEFATCLADLDELIGGACSGQIFTGCDDVDELQLDEPLDATSDVSGSPTPFWSATDFFLAAADDSVDQDFLTFLENLNTCSGRQGTGDEQFCSSSCVPGIAPTCSPGFSGLVQVPGSGVVNLSPPISDPHSVRSVGSARSIEVEVVSEPASGGLATAELDVVQLISDVGGIQGDQNDSVGLRKHLGSSSTENNNSPVHGNSQSVYRSTGVGSSCLVLDKQSSEPVVDMVANLTGRYSAPCTPVGQSVFDPVLVTPRKASDAYQFSTYSTEVYVWQPYLTDTNRTVDPKLLLAASGNLKTAPRVFAKYPDIDACLSRPASPPETCYPNIFPLKSLECMSFEEYLVLPHETLHSIFRCRPLLVTGTPRMDGLSKWNASTMCMLGDIDVMRCAVDGSLSSKDSVAGGVVTVTMRKVLEEGERVNSCKPVHFVDIPGHGDFYCPVQLVTDIFAYKQTLSNASLRETVPGDNMWHFVATKDVFTRSRINTEGAALMILVEVGAKLIFMRLPASLDVSRAARISHSIDVSGRMCLFENTDGWLVQGVLLRPGDMLLVPPGTYYLQQTTWELFHAFVASDLVETLDCTKNRGSLVRILAFWYQEFVTRNWEPTRNWNDEAKHMPEWTSMSGVLDFLSLANIFEFGLVLWPEAYSADVCYSDQVRELQLGRGWSRELFDRLTRLFDIQLIRDGNVVQGTSSESVWLEVRLSFLVQQMICLLNHTRMAAVHGLVASSAEERVFRFMERSFQEHGDIGSLAWDRFCSVRAGADQSSCLFKIPMDCDSYRWLYHAHFDNPYTFQLSTKEGTIYVDSSWIDVHRRLDLAVVDVNRTLRAYKPSSVCSSVGSTLNESSDSDSDLESNLPFESQWKVLASAVEAAEHIEQEYS